MLLNLATHPRAVEALADPETTIAAPRVSVVMTTYNGVRFLPEQIDSILRQSCTDIELIIADDCSTDATPALLRAYAERDDRVRIFFNEENLGVHRNLEKALRLAHGDFIAISDQDDIWDPRKLERLLQHIGRRSAAYSDSLLIDAEGESLGTTLLQRLHLKHPATEGHAVALLRKNCVSGHALLFRRELLDIALPFDARLMFDQQLGFFAAMAQGLAFIEQPLVRHRIHDANQCNGRLAAHMPHGKRRAERLQRYRRRRAELVEKLECCHALLANLKPANDSGRIAQTAAALQKIAARMRRFEQTFFDLPLFFLLWSLRKQVFYLDEDKGLHLCLKYAKGARYYALTSAAD